MITIGEQNRVDAREIYNFIEVKSRFNEWVKNSINAVDAVEGVDFFKVKSESTGGRPAIEYDLTLDCAILFCTMVLRSCKKASLVYKYLCGIRGHSVVIEARTRKEIMFEMTLKEVFEGIVEIESQYSVLNYRLDFYIPSIKLAIEYDEKHHKNYIEDDNKRQEEIKKHLGCEFIRVSEGEEMLGLNKINKHILFNPTEKQ